MIDAPATDTSDFGISNLIELSVSLNTTITSSVSFATRPIGRLFRITVLLKRSLGYFPSYAARSASVVVCFDSFSIFIELSTLSPASALLCAAAIFRSEEHTSELQSRQYLV